MVSTPGRERSQTSQTRKTDCPVWPAEEGKGPERGSAVTRQRDRNIVIGCDPPQQQRVGGARRPCWNCWLWTRKIFWDGLPTMMMMMTDRCGCAFFSFSPSQDANSLVGNLSVCSPCCGPTWPFVK
ncbi:uncharacterized protein BO88DRAFT_269372 [Aspergillus vadensis CBS 113365]|uniref:Uncharacterized protein n=1 Tax=Aspergillus vadensis (strain CBS 113365 / IMI 142717 / IBT 24658) TaxID=1448311 RepID=A0A319BC07_ASPVC|nr:hypothetical protein BO88DRAFT_269372 [Aspergillus vadensis CBS 113365]PYH69859.1 hypothetical protein BO88DRAFT_269372 [Aspergillus vadensis CBS 113365]